MDKDYDEFEFRFSDVTVMESEGVFEEIKKIMEAEMWERHEWMIKTELEIYNKTGISFMVLHLYFNCDVFIVDYSSSIGDVFYNPDIQALHAWATSNGWNIPQPTKDVINTDIMFWKHFWEVSLIDSKILEEKFGERDIIYNDSDEEYEEHEECEEYTDNGE